MRINFNAQHYGDINFAAKINQKIVQSAKSYIKEEEESEKLECAIKNIEQASPDAEVALEEHLRGASQYGCAHLGGGFASIILIPPKNSGRQNVCLGNVNYTDDDTAYEDELARKSYNILTGKTLRANLRSLIS